jgi:hypothetical protein
VQFGCFECLIVPCAVTSENQHSGGPTWQACEGRLDSWPLRDDTPDVYWRSEDVVHVDSVHLCKRGIWDVGGPHSIVPRVSWKSLPRSDDGVGKSCILGAANYNSRP